MHICENRDVWVRDESYLQHPPNISVRVVAQSEIRARVIPPATSAIVVLKTVGYILCFCLYCTTFEPHLHLEWTTDWSVVVA